MILSNTQASTAENLFVVRYTKFEKVCVLRHLLCLKTGERAGSDRPFWKFFGQIKLIHKIGID